MIGFTEIPPATDTWELFARDFLIERGFYIESPPSRGPDGGKDMLVVEQLSGKVGNYRMRWLVGCKNFAKSRKSVSENDEQNILERLTSFSADGFIGFHSTVASSSLNSRLEALREQNSIKDYAIFDHRIVENLLVMAGYSHLLARYFPTSYQKVKPLHFVASEYVPLPCEICQKDILQELFRANHVGNLVYVCRDNPDSTGSKWHPKLSLPWTDIGDLVIPIEFLRFCFATMNRIRDRQDVYTDEVFRKEKAILIAIAQKVLRITTDGDRSRFRELQTVPLYC